jgi:transcriptional regulator GlxA family with amidase domain
MRVGILLYDGVDVIDAGGPYEVLHTAARLRARDGLDAGLEVELYSPGGADVVAYGGLTIASLRNPATASCDAVIVPGTTQLDEVLASPEIARAVADVTTGVPLVASVCTGAFLLAQAGLTTDLDVTTHWEDLGALRAMEATGAVIEGVRWVDSGDVVTSGGLTSGLHMALHLVERWFGGDLAARTARQLDLDWSPDPRR